MRSSRPQLRLLALVLLLYPGALAAQAGDSTATKVAPGDSAAAKPAPPPPARVMTAADSILAIACKPGESGYAPEVVAVLFKKRTTEADHQAAAKAVGGRLVPVGGPGAYIRLPKGGGSRGASERLIGMTSVAGVSEVACPR